MPIPFLFFISESPKFLLTRNGERDDEAFKIIEKIIPEDNKFLLNPDTKLKIKQQYRDYMKSDNSSKNNYLDLFSNKHIKTSILLFIMWYIVSYVYYGLIYILPAIYEKLELSSKKSNIVNKESYDRIVSDIIISCIFEIPSNIINGILPLFFDKRNIIMWFFLGSGIFSTSCCFLKNSIPILTSINKACINVAFNVLYIYTSDAFPTYMRATSIGTCNFFSRIGGFTTPFICELLLSLSFESPFIGFSISSFLGVILTLLLEEQNNENNY